MAVVQNPIIGRAKNKFSNAIFSTWVGKNVLRSKPLSVANPRTERQIVNRERIAFLARGAKALREVILSTLRSLRQGKTQYNAFASINYGNFAPFDSGADEEIYLSPEQIRISTGTLDISGVGITPSTGELSLFNFSASVRENLVVYVAYFSTVADAISPNPFLTVTKVNVNGATTVSFPILPDALSATVVIENRVTGQNGQLPTVNL